MKKIACIFLISVLTLQSCSAQEKYCTIFVDQSSSVQIDKKVLTRYLRQALAEYLTEDNTTTVDVKLIFDNTASIANSTKFTYRLMPSFEAAMYEPDKRVMQSKLHKARAQQNKLLFITKIVNFITELEGTAHRTEILEILVPLSKLKHPSKVIVISDMIQESALADITKANIHKETEMVALAKENVKALQDTFIIPDELQNIELTCLMPVAQNTNNPLYLYLESYWRTCFKSFNINVHFERL